MNSKKIKDLIKTAKYQKAYELIVSELKKSPENEKIIELSKQLSAAVRGRCMQLASNKATEMSLEAYSNEALLKEIIKINGETIYG